MENLITSEFIRLYIKQKKQESILLKMAGISMNDLNLWELQKQDIFVKQKQEITKL